MQSGDPFANLEDEYIPTRPSPRRSDSAGIQRTLVLFGVGVLFLLALIAGFLVYKDQRDEARLEREKLIRRLDEVNGVIAKMTSINQALRDLNDGPLGKFRTPEEKARDAKEDRINVAFLREMEDERRMLIRKLGQ